MMLKLEFISKMQESTDILEVHALLRSFLKLSLISYAIPSISQFQKDFKEGLNYY